MVAYALLIPTTVKIQQRQSHKTISLSCTTPFHPLLPRLLESPALIKYCLCYGILKELYVLPNVGLLAAMFSCMPD